MKRNFTVIFAALLMCATLIAYLGNNLHLGGFALANSEICTYTDLKASEKTVFLTFDDGPSDRVTPRILDTLRDEGVKATFFIVGKHAEPRKYLIKREFKEGHTVAVHSYSHKYGEIYSSCEMLLDDIDKCNRIIKEITGDYSGVYRFPGGSFGLDAKFLNAVSRHGLTYVDWNASTCDAEIYKATAAEIYKATVSTTKNALASSKNIVLLAHDSTTKSATADALRDIIRYYKSEGFTFKTL